MPQLPATDVRASSPVRSTNNGMPREPVPERLELGTAPRRPIVLRRSLRIGRNLGIFFAALIATSYAIHSLAPPRALPSPLREKLAHFAAHRDEYDVVFIGSSLIQMHLSPAEFDAEMALQGHPVKSFNFGASAMLDQEADQLLAEIYALRPQRLKCVVSELYIWEHLRPAVNEAFKPRELWWLDDEGMPAICRRICESPLPPHKVSGSLAVRSLQYAARSARIGEGPRIVASWIGWHDLGERDDPQAADHQGFTPLDAGPDEPASHRRSRLAFQRPESQAEFARLVEEMPVSSLDKVAYRPEAVAARSRQAAEHGVETIFVVPPLARATPRIAEVELQPDVACVIKLNDPARYPELYSSEHRWDLRHLTDAGAREMTRRVAREIAAHWKSEGR